MGMHLTRDDSALVRKFFYSIDRTVLRAQIERKIKDRRFIDVMMQFARMDTPTGIPIGNLLSQTYALITLSGLDHFAKRTLKARHYARYMDDFIAIGLTLDEALRFKRETEAFVVNGLNLSLSHWMIAKIKRGINFVGYRTWRSVRFVRKHSVLSFKRAVGLGNINSITSLLGHAAHSSSIVFFANYLRFKPIFNQLPLRSKLLCRVIYSTHQHKTKPQPCDLSTKVSIAA